MIPHPHGNKVYPTEIEAKIAAQREGRLILPSLDFTCTGENCKCLHHEENTDDR